MRKMAIMFCIAILMMAVLTACSETTIETTETTHTMQITESTIEMETEEKEETEVETEIEFTTTTTEISLKLEDLPLEIEGVTFKEATLVIKEVPIQEDMDPARHNKLVIKVEGNSKDFSFTTKDSGLASVQSFVFYENDTLIHYEPYGIRSLNLVEISEKIVRVEAFSPNCETITVKARAFSQLLEIGGNTIPIIEYVFVE